ncbi:MAG: transferase [Gammaproteobacteria bacterium]|nr:transferase [Gammaproteobacteria bacterium]NIN37253.1 transferase [Gammaproteobacteria bacterium]NIO26111.1 transferase [Gammaproteobacteria bacterium]NIO66724.1 transferase [Gammaproteobacteria bacterium]NIP65877.1 transferase [Gammaproteobacteria bacterium]
MTGSRRSQGTGLGPWEFAYLGESTVIEQGVLVFHPETITIADNVYIGHQTILKGYHKNKMSIGAGTWIGQQCFLHSAGGIQIGPRVGIGPGVKIFTSVHTPTPMPAPIIEADLEFAPVCIGEGCDIGIGAIVMPGVTVGRGVQIGAGAVVTRDIEDGQVVAGVPARLLKTRKNGR